MLRAQFAEHCEPVATWKHDVEHESVEGFIERELQAGLAIGGGDDFRASLRERLFKRTGDFDLIFDNEHAHRRDAAGAACAGQTEPDF